MPLNDEPQADTIATVHGARDHGAVVLALPRILDDQRDEPAEVRLETLTAHGVAGIHLTAGQAIILAAALEEAAALTRHANRATRTRWTAP